MFEVDNLTSSNFPPMSLSLRPGELVCLSGPSGCGKTLLLRALADLDVNSGSVALDGVQRELLPAAQWRSRVAYLPAESRWWAATVGEHFRADQQTLLSALGFSADVSGWQVDRLSSGERQRLAVARVLANRPRVLLLDEPTANLDPANSRKVERLVQDYIEEQQATCLWVTHAPEQIARIASRSLHLDRHGLQTRSAA